MFLTQFFCNLILVSTVERQNIIYLRLFIFSVKDWQCVYFMYKKRRIKKCSFWEFGASLTINSKLYNCQLIYISILLEHKFCSALLVQYFENSNAQAKQNWKGNWLPIKMILETEVYIILFYWSNISIQGWYFKLFISFNII